MSESARAQTDPTAGSLSSEADQLEALRRMQLLTSYYRWTYSLLAEFIGARVVDIGCGIGSLTELLLDRCDCVLAVDRSRQHLAALAERFPGRTNLETMPLDLETGDFRELGGYRFDTIVCLDVLEHIRDDRGLLQRLIQVAEPCAKLLVKVPACPRLYGPIDVASGHHRRYSRERLCTLACESGWRPISIRYMNLFGLLPYWFQNAVLRKQVNFSRTFSLRKLNLIHTMMPLLQRLDRWAGPPLGLSAVLVAEKPR